VPLSLLVARLGLEPHVEGGYYRELWRSDQVLPQSLLGARYGGARASASSIYFLLHPGEVSAWHVIVSAELWLYHLGSPLTLTLGGCGENPDTGAAEPLRLGPDIASGERPQQLVPPGVWQRAENTGTEATLVSCIVSPAFHEQEFRLIGG
jgi:predicted cupin superfamily sugar epimerase